jgi:hypothetical protein
MTKRHPDQSPEAQRERALAWRSTPEAKARKLAWRSTDEAKASATARRSTPAAKASALARRSTPKAKAAKLAAALARRSTPEGLTHTRNRNRNASSKRRVLKLGLYSVEHDTPMPADGCCPHCRVPMTGNHHGCGRSDINAPTQDHIIPLEPRLGEPQGHHEPGNTMMICCTCNRSKHNSPLEVFLAKPARIKMQFQLKEQSVSLHMGALQY